MNITPILQDKDAIKELKVLFFWIKILVIPILILLYLDYVWYQCVIECDWKPRPLAFPVVLACILIIAPIVSIIVVLCTIYDDYKYIDQKESLYCSECGCRISVGRSAKYDAKTGQPTYAYHFIGCNDKESSDCHNPIR